MADKITRREALLGGPGLDGYAYCADVYCVPCGRDIIQRAPQAVFSDSRALDSDCLPQPIFFGEHETTQHCADCGTYLYGGVSHGR